MVAKIVGAVQTYRCCDVCFRGMTKDQYRETGELRPIIGGNGDMTPVVLCPQCFDWYGAEDEHGADSAT